MTRSCWTGTGDESRSSECLGGPAVTAPLPDRDMLDLPRPACGAAGCGVASTEVSAAASPLRFRFGRGRRSPVHVHASDAFEVDIVTGEVRLGCSRP